MSHVALSEVTANVGLSDVSVSSRRPTDKLDVSSSSDVSQEYLVLNIGFPIIHNVYTTCIKRYHFPITHNVYTACIKRCHLFVQCLRICITSVCFYINVGFVS